MTRDVGNCNWPVIWDRFMKLLCTFEESAELRKYFRVKSEVSTGQHELKQNPKFLSYKIYDLIKKYFKP